MVVFDGNIFVLKKGFDHKWLPRKVILGGIETKSLNNLLLTEVELSSIVGIMTF